MAEDSDLEKTEAATGKRIERAREDGKVVQSKELAIFIQLMTAVGGLMLMGTYIMEKLIALTRHGLYLWLIAASAGPKAPCGTAGAMMHVNDRRP